MSSVLVIGSSNTDMVLRVRDLPLPGQTVMGDDLQIFAGGKGANQAVAAKRAGGDVRIIAAVGDDDFGKSAIKTFTDEGIDTRLLQTIPDRTSGVALIFVSDAGENCIGVAPGANSALTPGHLQSCEAAFAWADIVLLQLETPLDTVAAAIELASRHGIRCMLNPAPAAPLPDSMIAGLYCITPNETEAEILTGVRVTDNASAIAAATTLLRRGVQHVVITLGANGALLHNNEGSHFQAARAVEVVDTTGAGDTFNGVFAAMLAQGAAIRDALEIAVDAATQSTQLPGAIPSIPRLSQ